MDLGARQVFDSGFGDQVRCWLLGFRLCNGYTLVIN